MDEDLALIEHGVSVARREAEFERSVVLAHEIDRVLSARAAECKQPGLVVDVADTASIGDVRVVGTSAELTFVFDNLLGNALRAVRGLDKAEIRLTTSVEKNIVNVEVTDTGTGIAHAEHDRIFQRGVSEREGGGHGLPRSREILERRGGSLELVRSAPGDGAVFEVRLRAVAGDA